MDIENQLANKYYDKDNCRLVYLGNSSSQENWDYHWDNAKTEVRNEFVSKITRKYLKKGSYVLEAGCGVGDKVYTLNQDGYKVVGLDWASKTVERIKTSNPELNCIVGDVRHMPYADRTFDGCWSLGVIEHFPEGFEVALGEAARILKVDGYLFLTVPSMNPLRKIKAAFSAYTSWSRPIGWEKSFYQFVLDPDKIVNAAKTFNLVPVDVHFMDGVKGLKDEVPFLQPILGPIYSSKKLPLKVARKLLQVCLSPFSGHICLFVLKKTS
ncbi:class I SAM-dependent methyltransferase [Bdellovibrio sp. HCB2-146]|uniref:class I SAM-dependent methyltransferase n=1 Tax=Bdellovibrio sp. HCB2-146 TaxID=3394362 RepID=UPI0039BC3269